MAPVAQYRLSPRTRKVVLLLHIATAGAWLGMDLVLGILVVTALTTDPVASGAAATSIVRFTTWPLVAVGLATLASGIVLGVGSKYGLVRYWWVFVKLVLNIVLVVLVIRLLGPGTVELSGAGREALAGGTTPTVTLQLLFPPLVSSTAVLTAIALSVFKPWGRRARGRRAAGIRAAAAGEDFGR